MYGLCLPCGKCSRLQRRLQAATKAATEVVGGCGGCCEGCHIGAAEDATLVAGCRKGFHIGGRLQQRLHVDVKAATEVDGCCEGCYKGFRMLGGLQEILLALRRLSYRKATQRLWLRPSFLKQNPNKGSYEGNLTEVWEAVAEVVVDIMGGSYGDNAY
ncbi:hypothetical protein Tco_0677490 [Tanacetum coccineum]|uniref:Uncharacterized protein n=1 Tax=Tanacetum coccineum TaxID=301880 RepID=A0ABQ4XDN2_9ASTR